MTYFPDYLKTYPNMDTTSPLHISLNTITNGFRAHRHDFLEFSYVVDGQGSESINGVLHPMRPGTFTFVLPYQVHQIYTDVGSKLVLYNCMFSMDLLMESSKRERLIDLIDSIDRPAFALFQGDERMKMDELIEEMYNEYNGQASWKEAMLQIQLKEVLIRFDRYRGESGASTSSVYVKGNRQSSIWPIIHYIHQNYHEDITLADLASHFKMSVSRISEVIKETTGQNFLHFLNDLRIRHACSLLASTEMSVSEIALEVGYNSYNTFSRVFRESKGVVPTDYRKMRMVNQ